MERFGFGAVLRALVRAFSATVLVVALASVGGRLNNTLDAFAQLAPLWIAAAAVTAVAAVATASRWALTVALAAFVCGGVLAGPPLVQAWLTPSPPDRPPDLTVVQFNAWALNRDPQASAEWIAAQRPDIVTMEEVEGAGGDVRRALEAAGYRAPAACGARRCRALVMSRLPIASGGTLARAPDWISASASEIQSSTGLITVVAAHTGWPWPVAKSSAQLDDLVSAVTKLPSTCKIVAGDFNASPWSHRLAELERRLDLERRSRVTPSWPARQTTGVPFAPPLPIFSIDHVFASGCWRFSDARRGPRLGSDHYPLIVRLWR